MPRAFNLELEQRWRERFRRFEQSGLSVREFCRSLDIREHTFFAWRRELIRRDRLRQTAQDSSVPAAPQRRASRRPGQQRPATRQPNSGAKRAHSNSAFVPVQIISDPLAPSCFEVRIGAYLLRVPTSIDEPALRQAIRVLREEIAGC